MGDASGSQLQFLVWFPQGHSEQLPSTAFEGGSIGTPGTPQAGGSRSVVGLGKLGHTASSTCGA